MRSLLILLLTASTLMGGEVLLTFNGQILRKITEIDLWSPSNITPVAWYDAADTNFIGFAGPTVNVSTWYDKSANGYDLAQSNGGKQPEYVTNAINGLACLWYSGTLDQMFNELASTVDVTNLTMIAVGMGATGDWPAYGYLKNTAGTDSIDHRHQSGITQGKIAASWKIDGTSPNTSTANSAALAEYVPCISVVYYDGFKTASRANGGALTAQNTGAPDGATFSIDRIQCGRQSNTPRNYQGEYIILDTADIATIELVEGYLAWKWGIENALPVNHPYRQLPPGDATYSMAFTIGEDPQWTPSNMTTVAWYDASDTNTLGLVGATDRVSTWYDKSGNGNHALQATGAEQPDTGVASIGGLNAIQFQASNAEHMDVADAASLNFDGDGGLSYFGVLNYKGYLNQGSGVNSIMMKGLALGAEPAYGWRITSSELIRHKGGTDYDVIVGDLRNQDILLSAVVDQGTQMEGWTDGTSDGTDSTGTGVSDNTDDLRLGGDPTGARFADVDFGEILIVAGVVSTDTRQKVEGYLAWKWGLESKLPVAHPYKQEPPTQ